MKTLHNHPKMEEMYDLDKNHVIVDRLDWEKTRKTIKDLIITIDQEIAIRRLLSDVFKKECAKEIKKSKSETVKTLQSISKNLKKLRIS